MRNLIKIISFLPKKYKILCFLIILMSLLLSLSEVLVLSSIKPFIESFSNLNINDLGDTDINRYKNIINGAYKFLLIVVLCGVLRVILIFFQYRTAATISTKISSKTFKNIIFQDYIFLKSANQSRYLSVLVQDIPRISEALSNFACFISNVILIFFISISLLFLETKLFLISGFVISLMYFLILLTFAKKLKLNGENITKFNHLQASLVRSTLASIVDFIVNRTSYKQAELYKKNERISRLSYANTLIYSQTPRYLVETACLALVTVFLILSINNESGLLIFAQLGTLLFAFNRALPAAQQIYASYAHIKSSSASIINVIEILKLKKINLFNSVSKINSSLKKNIFNLKNNQISITKLKFGYDKKDINYKNFIFKQGIPTALLGKSGSGKSTLIELILRLLEPLEGEIRLNNIDIKEIELDYYYQNISYLPQSPFLFSGTLLENIFFGNQSKIDIDELYQNGIKLGLKKEFGDNFLDYKISDFGRNISGGQAQRCSLLKVISNIKPIIIIDEPSSALDSNTASIFNNLLLSKAKNSILIVITHSELQANLFPSRFDL